MGPSNHLLKFAPCKSKEAKYLDSKILNKCIRGDRKAQREVYESYRSGWFMTCLRYANDRSVAEDMMQEGLIQIYKDMHQFDPTRSKFITWSSRVLAHAAIRYLKRNKWQNSFAELDQIIEEPYEDEFSHSALHTQELIKLIQELPVGYRVVFNLYVIEGFTHKEIAQKLGIQIGTSKSQLSKARRELRSKLEKQLTYYPL